MKTPKHNAMRPEWEPCKAVLLAWPHKDTDWAHMLPQVEECYRNMAAAIAPSARLIIVTPNPLHVSQQLQQAGVDTATVVEMPTNDTWTRDYGPIASLDADGNSVYANFCFNGWGLKFAANHDNLVNGHLTEQGILPEMSNHLGFVLEGGSLETDGEGTLLTTSRCLLSPNRNGDLTRAQVEDYLKKTPGCSRVLWVENGFLEGDDTDSHIDTLARFVPNNTIVYVGAPDAADIHYAELQAMRAELQAMRTADGKPYRLVELPMAAAAYDEDGQRLPATYANFLLINGAVIMPVYGNPELDALAVQRMAEACPGWEIRTVDCNALIRQHGSLHCATMQLPRTNV